MKESRANILLVEDEEHLHETIKMNLEIEGYSVTSAYTGTEAMKCINEEYFHLIVLDLMLPGMDGISIVEAVRLKHLETPILIVSAKGAGSDRVLGLKKGADDYMTKPFNLEEFLLRVDKLVSKNKKLQDKETVGDHYEFGGNKIDFKAQTAVTFSGGYVELSKKESMLLKLLVENENQVVAREKILQMVWGYNVYPTTRTIDNFILSFRKYFEKDSKDPKHFHSIRGVGYKFTA